MGKLVYFFGNGEAEGDAKQRDLLGGKGANLAEMTNLGIPVPPGFTIATDVCEAYYTNNKQHPAGLKEEVEANLARLEQVMGKKLGDPEDPLLVSVRSGAAVSMPGMMETVLNLGLNDKAVEGLAKRSGNPRFAYDAYRRFIQMFGNVVMGVSSEHFEKELDKLKKKRGVKEDTELQAEDLKGLVKTFKEVYAKHTKKPFPQDPKEQLWAAIDAVLESWNSPKAVKYRSIHSIRGLKGTAVNVQAMVFGNYGNDSGTGVCFSRDPSTGENKFYGEYLINAQGEDVVAGIRTPEKISQLEKKNPEVYRQLVEIKNRLEAHFKDMQDIEFTIQQGKLYILQTRTGKRTGPAAVKMAVDMVHEGLITKEEAIKRIDPEQLYQLFHPQIDPKAKKSATFLAKGLNASPGAASGQIVFTAEDAEAWAASKKSVILVRKETSPEDIGGMHAAKGILTATGGMTSHAAVVARGMGRPCVAGCTELFISGKTMRVKGKTFKEGDYITIDGTTGEVFEGSLNLILPKLSEEYHTLMSWVDEVRWGADREGVMEKGFRVRTNADTPNDAKVAREFGAEGIGLCRTEHMFFEAGKLVIFQEMIVAEDSEARRKALRKLLPLQKKDFVGIFKEMHGLPVTVRLLDPPLHEFVPKTKGEIRELARTLGVSPSKLEAKVQSLHEFNPMLGHRGCRLGITYPEIYDMQVEAIITAACEVAEKGIQVIPEIMFPLVGTVREMALLKERAERIIGEILRKRKAQITYKLGTMIELPRAAIIADKLASLVDFFSFGTNDLTQCVYGYSRDDVGSFLPVYLEQNILEEDPFKSLDQEGVGTLVRMAAESSKKVKPEIKLGICGEHGGDPKSIDFCYRVGMNYVSCSPYRVPVARLAAAQAVLRNGKKI